MMIEFIKKYLNLCPVAGNEKEAADFIKNTVSAYADECYTDNMGNLIAFCKSAQKKAKKLLITCNLDVFGGVVTYIDESGKISISKLGEANFSPGTGVRFSGGTCGVLEKDNENFFADIGSSSKEESERHVKIGEAVTAGSNLQKLLNGKIFGFCADDIAAVYILCSLLKEKEKSAYDIYYVFSSQSKLGFRGIQTAAYNINPDEAIIVDSFDSDEKKSEIAVGGGCGVRVKDGMCISSPQFCESLCVLAEENNIKYKKIITDGKSEAKFVSAAAEGCRFAGVCIPAKRTGLFSVISENDISCAKNLLSEYIKRGI